MDGERFDGLIRALGSGTSRRGALGLLAAVAGLGVSEVTAKARHHRKGKGKSKGKQTAHSGRAAKRRHHQQQDQPTAAGQKCQGPGKPCEGTQSCCANLVCTRDGKALAMRCTACPSPTVAWQGVCCTPATKCLGNQNCDTQPDNCGGTVTCGHCTLPQTCGGGGTPGVCGCTPATKCPAGQNCGTAPDGCGGTINCGTCTAPQTCGGGGTPNQCGCTKTTCAAQNAACGSVSDGCDGTLNCGGCTAPQTCGGGGTANQCGCTPATKCPAGQNCGTASDGCGGTINCGTCTAPQSCGGGNPGKPNVCGCTPTTTTCPAGQQCGSVPDGCGGSVDCGTCPAGQQCDGTGKCFCSPVGPDQTIPTNCDGICVDTNTDANNCGGCGNTCPANIACNVGQDSPAPGKPINNCCNLDNEFCSKDEDCCRCYDGTVERCICSESEGRCIQTEIG